MPRLFTGLEVPRDVAMQLSLLRGGLPGARWIDPENYHITLRFVGDVDNRTASDFDASLGAVRPRGPIEVSLQELASFGGDRPRAVFAKAEASRTLFELQNDHERAARMAGAEPEKRRFTPHVTLARLRDSSPLDVADYFSARCFRRLAFTARRFVLFSSRDSVGGGPYVVEAAYPL